MCTNHHVAAIRQSQLTELRGASQTANSMRTVTFWPSVTAARMKSREWWMLVGGMLFPFRVFSIVAWTLFEHTSKAWMGIIAIAWKNSRIDTIFEKTHSYTMVSNLKLGAVLCVWIGMIVWPKQYLFGQLHSCPFETFLLA